MSKKMFTAFGTAFLFILIVTGVSAQGVHPPGSPQPVKAQFVSDQVLVRFQPWIGRSQADKVLAAERLTRIRNIPALEVQVLQLPPGLSVERARR